MHYRSLEISKSVEVSLINLCPAKLLSFTLLTVFLFHVYRNKGISFLFTEHLGECLGHLQ